jgi:hypothetical protein
LLLASLVALPLVLVLLVRRHRPVTPAPGGPASPPAEPLDTFFFSLCVAIAAAFIAVIALIEVL